MAMKLLMRRYAILAFAGGWLFAGSAVAQTTQPTNPPATTPRAAPAARATGTAGNMPATVHQQRVLRNLHKNRSTKTMPATVHQQQVLRNLHTHPSAEPTH
jgi:hypothetical protein